MLNPCCTMYSFNYVPSNPASELIELAEALQSQPTRVLMAFREYSEEEYTTIRLAVNFNRLPPDVRLRALFEDWSKERIIQEVY